MDTGRVPRQTVDSTGKLKQSDVEKGALAKPGFAFFWPTPPYYEIENSGPGGAEPCLLIFKDEAKATGSLHNFSHDEMVVRFQQTNTVARVSVGFAEILTLELLRPVSISRQKLPAEMEQRVFRASDRQPFVIELANGKRVVGETVSFIEALCGLFLFIPEKEGTVVRRFVPAAAVKSYTIGKPIGELFVEQKLASAEAVDVALQKQAMLRNRRFGEYLTQNQIVSSDQLNAALKQQRAQPVQKLGDTLVELGYLTPAELKEALYIEERNRSIPLGQILADMGVVDAEIVNSLMAQKLGIPFVNLQAFDVAPEILKRIPAAVAHRYQIVPIAETDNSLVIAMDNPMNMGKMEDLRFIAGYKLIAVMASASDIRQALQRNYGEAKVAEAGVRAPGNTEVPVHELTARLAAESADVELNERQAAENDTTLVKLVNKIITDAVEQKASDIHLEANPGGRSTRVRFRKDGVLVTYLEMPAKFRKAVISRIKIMAQLDITERRKPQDGKIEFSRFGPARVELRVATIPTANGLEDVVMRVLAAATPMPMETLGLGPDALEAIQRAISRPHGLFLVCGPTGSGKTTTLHSLLGFLNTPELKIWTAEDPIEIVQPGLRQVQVNPKVGWSFPQAMRAFMRGDPDVIMVGEMRDAETTKIGIEASLTGHLVLSTLHTNSAAESVVRLLDLGMDPFNFADALLGVLAQRLVRQLCASCKQPYSPAKDELEDLALEYCSGTALDPAAQLQRWRNELGNEGFTLYQPRGCERCDRTGYKGRMGVYELLIADAAVKRLVQTRAPIPEITAAAVAGGMRLLKQDGISKILQGLTDIRQIRTV